MNILQKKNNVNQNKYININFENEFSELQNDVNNQTINLSDFFSYEREESKNYKIYGKIDYISILNNLKNNYYLKSDFFERYTKEPSKNIINSFDVYLLQKSNVFDLILNNYVFKYKVIAKPEDIDIIKSSYSKNLFYEDLYFINIKKNINIYNNYDFFNKPITELFLYFKYKNNNPLKNEKLYSKKYNSFSDKNNNQITEITNEVYNYGDNILGSLFEYENNSFDEKIINSQEYSIEMEYDNENVLKFKYNPFHEIKIRYYSDNLNFSNIKLKNIINIPDYAKKVDQYNNYIWRDILEYGYIDPISNLGLDFPFINNTHYIFNNMSLIVRPNLEDQHTNNFFENIKINSYNTNLFKQNPLIINNSC